MFEVPALPIPRLARVSVGAYRHTRLERGQALVLPGLAWLHPGSADYWKVETRYPV